MKCLEWNGKNIQLNERPLPVYEKDEALVKVLCAGICHTDKEIMEGYYDFRGTLGHEFVGQVEKCQDDKWMGKRVVADINCACLTCSSCKRDDFHHCLNRKVVGIKDKDGCFAEYINIPIRNLYMVPDNVPDESAVFCEPLAAALNSVSQVKNFNHSFQNNIEDNEVCVIGDGKLGLLMALSFASQGFQTTLLGHHVEERRKVVAGTTINYLASLPTEKKFSIVVEATGNPEGFQQGIYLLLPRGKLILKSTYVNPFSFNPASIVVNEIQILGSRCGDMQVALDLLEKKLIDPRPLIDQTFSINKGVEAIKYSLQKNTMKALIRF